MPVHSYVLALDQGTSSSRAMIVDARGQVVSLAQVPLSAQYPQPGWVEQDPVEIWQTQLLAARQALAQSGVQAQALAAIGITNQRETTLLWNRRSGEPLGPAIVWQDRRTEPQCRVLRELKHEERFRASTGLVLDPYFSGTKLAWMIQHIPEARAQAERGELAFGTVDTWLLWQLTGGAVHATDVSNASRTLMWNIHESRWDAELLALLKLTPSLLPQVYPSVHDYGQAQAQHLGAAIPIRGLAGDQQAALFGQACFDSSRVKNTYGTGCFMLRHTGPRAANSHNGLLCTRAAQPGDAPQFALEGSVFMGGAVVQWLRDGLGLIQHSTDVQALAQSVDDSAGVVMVPAFTGLGAPYWDAEARGAILGLTRGTTQAHIARAALESMAFQSAALLQAMDRDAQTQGLPAASELRVDGGACVNDLLMQFQADVLGIAVVRPRITETTALGAAYLAGLGAGLWQHTDELQALWQAERRFEPRMSPAQAQARMAQWEHAVRQVRSR